jgi:uncharacterized protein
MKYKLSFYVIITEIIDNESESPENTKRLLYATRSSNVLVIREKHYDILKSGEFENLPIELFDELRKIKAIVEYDEDELKAIIDENKTVIASNTNLHYVIQPTANCQLGCDYCGQEHSKSFLSETLINNTISRIKFLLLAKKFESLDIAWFGAEPLMGLKQMRILSPKLIELAAEQECTYYARIVTNGLSLKEEVYEELISDHKINFIEITLDGTEEFHDQRRHTKSKGETFKIIFNNILKIVNRPNFKQECTLSIRCNADSRNADNIIPFIEFLASHNLQDKVNFYIAPVYSWGNDAHLLTPKDDFAIREIDWLLALKENNFPVFPLPGRVHSVCTAVMEHDEVIDAYGNIFNCTEVPLVPTYNSGKYQIGKLATHDTFIPANEKPFVNWNDKILSKDETLWCWNCRIFPVCGGRCPKNWIEGIPPCPVMKFNMEDRVALTYYICKEETLDPLSKEEHITI